MSTPLSRLALDLTRDYPRSPRALFGGYVIAGRVLDKCRAILNGTGGEYDFNCGLDRVFFDYSEIVADEFRDFVATGASDEQVAEWIAKKATPRTPEELAVWNFELKCQRISEMPPASQAWAQGYLLEHVKPEVQERVIFKFDLLDAEEGRLG